MRWGTLSLVAALLVLGGRWAMAGPAGPGSEERDFNQELNLSKAQEERMAALRARIRAQSWELGQRMSDRRRELEAVYSRYEMEEPRARRLRQEIHDIQGQMLELQHEFQLELRKILTPSQFERVQQALRARWRRPPWGRPRGPGHRPGRMAPSSRMSPQEGGARSISLSA
jgi:Spy/CpxP family protein refolding chaperone